MGHGGRIRAISGRAFPHIPLRAGAALLLALAFTLASPAWHARAAEHETASAEADAADTYTRMLRRYDALNAELTHALNEVERDAQSSSFSPPRVLSMRKNASVTVGGELRATYAFAESSGVDPFFEPLPPGGRPIRQNGKTGELFLSTAKVSVDARLGDRWRAFIDINLHGHSGFHRAEKTRNPGINPVEQAYIELMKGDHSGFGAIFGKMKLPFGLWQRPNLFAKSFLDAPDLTGSHLMQPDGWTNGVRLPHASRFLDPALAALIYYEMRDIIRFDAAVFQEEDPAGGRGGWAHTRADGTREIRSREAPPQSWQVGMSIQPLENWELTAHFRNRHSRSRGIGYWADSPRWDFQGSGVGGAGDPAWNPVDRVWSDAGTGQAFGSRKNEQAVVVGLAVDVPTTNLSVSVEYARGWNQGFNKHINSDSVNIGLAYALTPRLTLYGQGEWLHVKDRSWMAETAPGSGVWSRDTRNNHLYRAMFGAEYALADCLTLEAGWQYEYWRATSAALAESRLTTANMLYFGTRFIF